MQVENLIEVNIHQDITVQSNRLVGTRPFQIGQQLLVIFWPYRCIFNWSIIDSEIIVAQ